MNKRMRELQIKILQKTNEAKALIEGEGMDITKASAIMNEVDDLQKELETLDRVEKAGKASVPADPETKKSVNGFKLIAKIIAKKPLDEVEKTALVSGTDSASGETYLIPEDVKAEINELRKSYVSAKPLVTVEVTDSLSGSVNYEHGVPAGLTAFDDGDAISEEDAVKFVKKTFTIGWMGKLIPISRILMKAAKANIMNYLNRWFVRNAVISENKDIFDTLKSGYKSGVPMAIVGWEAFKASITKDLDPSCLIDGIIITNQSGFAALDSEKYEDGKPVLQPNPANQTEKLFQGLVVHVFPDSQLANIDGTNFPMIYGSIKAGCTFVEHENLEFAVSDHYLFNKNQNCLRVIEGYDVMSTDTNAYIYGKFSKTPNPAA